MKQNDIGNPLAPRRAVTSHSDSGWIGVTEKRSVVGYACVYVCTLECGHQQQFITKTCVARGGDGPPAPFHMHCATCYKEEKVPF